MDSYDLNDRIFRLVSNTAGDAVPGQTRFHFHQRGRVLWAEYSGGDVVAGSLVGVFTDERSFNLVFHQVTSNDEIHTGRATSVVSTDRGGMLRIEEDWSFSDGSQQGKAVFEEAPGEP